MVSVRRLVVDFLTTPQRVRQRRRRLREIEEHPERALTTWTRESSAQLFYLFHGLEMRLMMDPLTVLRETGLIRRNLVMLRDYHRYYYHAGLNRDIPDVDAIDARLTTCRQEMPHVRQTFCLGTSSGGYAAILFGHRLGVDEVYAFAPQTRLSPYLLRMLSGRKDLWRIPEHHRDLSLLLSESNGRTKYKIFYCGDRAIDRRFAERIEDCPGVELHPQPGNTHLVLQVMHEAGTLRDALPGDVSTEGD